MMILLFAYLLLINIVDYVTTKILLSKGQFAEANPILSSLMVHLNTVDAILYFKMFFVGMLIALMALLYHRRPDRYNALSWRLIILAINLGLTGVVIRSLYYIYIT